MIIARARLTRRILPVVLGATVLAGCSGSGGTGHAKSAPPTVAASASPTASPSPTATPTGADDPALKPFYGQQIAWGACTDDGSYPNVDLSKFQCATAKVPLDYTHPAGDTVDLALVRRQATGKDQRVGSLFVNPGGPGGSGIEEVLYGADSEFKGLSDHFDLIGFDPRGVGKSSPVHCLDDAGHDQWYTQDHPAQNKGKTLADGCQANSGKLLPFVGTVNVARDLDVLRGAVGDQKLDYLGFSYGTYLGTSYAEQFPDRTGHLVLDGVMDPSQTLLDSDVQQMAGFEGVFERWAADCVTHSDCPLGKDPGTAAKKAADFLDGLAANPMTAKDGRQLTASQGWTGTLSMLYGSSKSWDNLRLGLGWAMQGNKPDYMLDFADGYNGRDAKGHYSNMQDAYAAITCADYGAVMPTDAQVDQALQDDQQKSPYLTKHFTKDDLFDPDCRAWPYHPSTPPQPISAPGAAPILVVGSTGDDATPYPWAQKAAAALPGAVLLTRDGDGHTGYGKSACIKTAVDTFLVSGTMPAANTHCPTDQ
ncbi:alpha/beta hydrolase [Kitasatospora viridis]|uniref:Tripeptidyl-peptidase B n=1 Tax=Kitasatospora viridis TaxID=281105 RepID=A0A561UMQ5_9ACTN|nr:alpha/beta hydrolase [Kitasatospora viridis]TWG00640.1 tripeptidyl-peptidase B [Kitasatospora viridis]